MVEIFSRGIRDSISHCVGRSVGRSAGWSVPPLLFRRFRHFASGFCINGTLLMLSCIRHSPLPLPLPTTLLPLPNPRDLGCRVYGLVYRSLQTFPTYFAILSPHYLTSPAGQLDAPSASL